MKVDQFVSVVNYTDMPYCKIVEGASGNIFMKNLLDLFRSKAGELLECCIRTGDFKVSNFSVANSSIIAFWPPGDYRVGVRFFDLDDDNIYKLSYTTTVFA